MSPRSPSGGGIIGHSTRYNANNNENPADNMIGGIEEEVDKEEEDADKDDRSLNPSSRKASNSQEVEPVAQQFAEEAPEASVPKHEVANPDIINFQNNSLEEEKHNCTEANNSVVVLQDARFNATLSNQTFEKIIKDDDPYKTHDIKGEPNPSINPSAGHYLSNSYSRPEIEKIVTPIEPYRAPTPPKITDNFVA